MQPTLYYPRPAPKLADISLYPTACLIIPKVHQCPPMDAFWLNVKVFAMLFPQPQKPKLEVPFTMLKKLFLFVMISFKLYTVFKNPQPSLGTPITTDNLSSQGIFTNFVKPQRSKTWEIRYHWLEDKIAQEKQLQLIWKT